VLHGGVIGQASSQEHRELPESELSYLEGMLQRYPAVSQPDVRCQI